MTLLKQHGDVFSSIVAVVVAVPNIGVLDHNGFTLDGMLSLSPQLQNVCGLEIPQSLHQQWGEQYMGEKTGEITT